MQNITVLKLVEHPALMQDAAHWFSKKWEVPFDAYLESMAACLAQKAPVPQWYVVVDGEKIIAGLGVIENDFHLRRDLAPNVCAVYVEKAYRMQGIARQMLATVCRDMHEKGIDTLYLITEHENFYEHCGWHYLCPVECDNGDISRMYVYTWKKEA